MELQHGSDESAVLLLHQEAAYADLGTVTPELVIKSPRATVIKFIPAPRVSPVPQDWSDWSWATAPPRRAA